MIDPVMAYAAITAGKPGYSAAIVDDGKVEAYTRDTVAEWIKDGRTVVRITLDEAGIGLQKYIEHRTQRKAMSTCGDCKHFEPARGPTGKPRPTQPGACGYPVVWPVLPQCFGTDNRWPPQWPHRNAVYAYEGYRCKVFAGKATTVAAPKQEGLL